MELIIPEIILAIIGLAFGFTLSLASRKFHVDVDKRVEKIVERLSGANCGVCGAAGCLQFAQGLVRGDSSLNACPVTTIENRQEIAEILGQELEIKTKCVAVLHCNGGNKVVDRFDYQGIKDCLAANLLSAGQKACIYGCLGFGSCVAACKFGAITMGFDGLPVVDESRCTACGACVKICPKNLFSLEPVDKEYYVACSSHDRGKEVMAVCKVGCIACKKCEIDCPTKAIVVVDNLAKFNYDKCKNIGKCFEVCPTKVIKTRPQLTERK